MGERKTAGILNLPFSSIVVSALPLRRSIRRFRHGPRSAPESRESPRSATYDHFFPPASIRVTGNGVKGKAFRLLTFGPSVTPHLLVDSEPALAEFLRALDASRDED